MKQHDTDLLAWDFHTWPKRDWILLKQRNIWPREWASLVNSTFSRWNVQRGIWWESPKQRWDIEDRNIHVDKITVFVDSDFAGDPVSRKSTTGLVAQIGNHTVKSGSTLQSLTALSVREAEFYAAVKGCQVGLSRNSNEDWNAEWQFDGEFCDGSVGSRTANEAGQLTKHNDTRYFWIQERVQDGDLSIKKLLTAKNCADVATKPVSGSVLQQHWMFAGLVFDWPWVPHSTTRWRWRAHDGSGNGVANPLWTQRPERDTETRRDHGNTSTETDSCQRWSRTSRWMCNLSETSERWTSLSTSHDEGKVQRNGKMQREILRTLTDAKLGENFRAHERSMTERADTCGIRTRLWCTRAVGDRFDTLDWSRCSWPSLE